MSSPPTNVTEEDRRNFSHIIGEFDNYFKVLQDSHNAITEDARTTKACSAISRLFCLSRTDDGDAPDMCS